ncbi:HlyD family secretion protein [Desulfosporosinus nitroreducens]|uniref:Efflux RND transporter periplasmic adaptor subunit n=1 Tax=Desulfosporosinus nitroreducens TaxID=2018668 RepID=A0ABT8QLR6_9FIRM|nr:efflux RND transporter periplasmic adaptor subunit [Desulfosporosinus nitroreducens]MCO1600757.1 efflux RND transporter periplasmic adaptor subunit [Desulfosporosinus nitroreducens]MDO0822276.1 efflux RND transporter periplasmic adaptor subunit [Desulfosporosinus nitroreducens]
MKRVVGILLIMSVLLTGCNSTSQKIETDTAVEVSKPVFVMAGIVDANEKAQINSKLSAKVSDISVEVGSVVKKGDSLITLDTKDIEAQVAQAEAGVNTAQANLIKMQAGARPEQIAQAQSALDSAKISYTNSKNNFDRNQQLLSAGAISQSQFETAQTQLAAAQAQYNSAQDQLNLLILGETEESLNVLRAQVAQSQAALELAKTQLTNGTIVSPISGIVSEKNINVGELASPGVTLISIVNVDSLYIKASLPEGLMGDVSVGEEVVVKVAEIKDQEFKGKISLIDPVIDSRSKSVLVRIQVDNPNSILKPGMLAEIGLIK